MDQLDGTKRHHQDWDQQVGKRQRHYEVVGLDFSTWGDEVEFGNGTLWKYCTINYVKAVFSFLTKEEYLHIKSNLQQIKGVSVLYFCILNVCSSGAEHRKVWMVHYMQYVEFLH